jgi:hypothetical protein
MAPPIDYSKGCENKKQLTTRERYFMELLNAQLNVNNPSRTIEEIKEHTNEFNKFYKFKMINKFKKLNRK